MSKRKDVTRQKKETITGNIFLTVNRVLDIGYRLFIGFAKLLNAKLNRNWSYAGYWGVLGFFMLFSSYQHPLTMLALIYVYIRGCIYCAYEDVKNIPNVQYDAIFDEDGHQVN